MLRVRPERKDYLIEKKDVPQHLECLVMSEMTIANKKLMLAGLYLSKFDRGKQGLKALGFKTLQEAYNSFALAVGGRPASVKNYMQEFDPYFPNSRQGWNKRGIRQTRQAIMDEFGGLDLEEFSELVKTQFAGSLDVDPLVGRTVVAAGLKEKESSSFARRIMTGQAAENYFEANYREVHQFKDCSLQRTTSFGCGFDFKLTPPRADFLAVEVKGISTPSGQIQMTEKEFRMANYLAKRFYLYVVTDFAHSPRPCVIENPIRAGITFEKRTVKSETNLWVAKISA